MSHPLKVRGLRRDARLQSQDAEAFYTKLLGRGPDDWPMQTLIQWRGFGMAAGIQLFVVPDMVQAKDEFVEV